MKRKQIQKLLLFIFVLIFQNSRYFPFKFENLCSGLMNRINLLKQNAKNYDIEISAYQKLKRNEI